MKRLPKNLTGMAFGLLTVVSNVGSHPTTRRTMWRCTCVCGEDTVVERRLLVDGRTKSCGCLAKNNARKHGHKSSEANGGASLTYSSWKAMWKRCTDEKHPAFDRYGG